MDHVPSGWISFCEAAELYQKALIGECQATEQDHSICFDGAMEQLQRALHEGLIRACILDRESGVLVTLAEEFWASTQVGKAIAEKDCSVANSDRPGHLAEGLVLICKSDLAEAAAPFEPTGSSAPRSSHEQELAAAPIEQAMSAEAALWAATAKHLVHWPIDFVLVYLGKEQNLEAAIAEYAVLVNMTQDDPDALSWHAYGIYSETSPITIRLLAQTGAIEVFGERTTRDGGHEPAAKISPREWLKLELNNGFGGGLGTYAAKPRTVHFNEGWRSLTVEREPFMKAVSKAQTHGLVSGNEINSLHKKIQEIADVLNPESGPPIVQATIFYGRIQNHVNEQLKRTVSHSTIKEALKGTKHLRPPKRKQVRVDGGGSADFAQ